MPLARRIVRSTVGPLGIYALLSLAFFGRPLLQGDRDYVGSHDHDPQIFIWSFGWWPHAILNGENPIVSHAMWPVTGVNLAWVAGAPGLAFLVAPVTLVAGPALAFNVAAVALPALAAWTAFLLCRYLTGNWWASLAGGYLFGFSSYMLAHTTSHLHMTSVFLVPLVALTVLQYVHARIGPRGLALRLGLLLGAQVYLSTEVFATLTVSLVTSLVVAFVVVPDARTAPAQRGASGARRVRRRLRRRRPDPLVRAHGLSHQLDQRPRALSSRPSQRRRPDGADVRERRPRERARRATFSATSPRTARTSVFRCLSCSAGSRGRGAAQPAGRMIVVLLALGIVAELGVALHVAGDRLIALPWALAAELPGFNNVLPVRFSMYVALAAAAAAALWAASPRPSRWVRTALVAAAVVSLLPAASRDFWSRTPTRPSFFVDDTYRTCFRPDENVFIPDATGMDATLWQAESGYRFRLANGSLSPELPEGTPDPDVGFAVLYGSVPEGGGGAVVRFARAIEATVILLDAEHVYRWGPVLEEAGLEPVANGGVWLYHLGPVPPACRA